jgi:hypothetical protein
VWKLHTHTLLLVGTDDVLSVLGTRIANIDIPVTAIISAVVPFPFNVTRQRLLCLEAE